jgi:hypothetical protein
MAIVTAAAKGQWKFSMMMVLLSEFFFQNDLGLYLRQWLAKLSMAFESIHVSSSSSFE